MKLFPVLIFLVIFSVFRLNCLSPMEDELLSQKESLGKDRYILEHEGELVAKIGFSQEMESYINILEWSNVSKINGSEKWEVSEREGITENQIQFRIKDQELSSEYLVSLNLRTANGKLMESSSWKACALDDSNDCITGSILPASQTYGLIIWGN